MEIEGQLPALLLLFDDDGLDVGAQLLALNLRLAIEIGVV
jgi:hypothetical protein